jgi:hypothetical protein
MARDWSGKLGSQFGPEGQKRNRAITTDGKRRN